MNTGQVDVSGGSIVLEGAVTGGGAISIAGGALELGTATAANVQFTQPRGLLRLDQSQDFTGTVSGFSSSGGTTLDLRGIAFIGSGEASFSGNTTGGILTVSDGSHTAHIQLAGDYLSTDFVASADGSGGVLVTANTGSAQPFVAAMAAFGEASAAHVSLPAAIGDLTPRQLARPMA